MNRAMSHNHVIIFGHVMNLGHVVNADHVITLDHVMNFSRAIQLSRVMNLCVFRKCLLSVLSVNQDLPCVMGVVHGVLSNQTIGRDRFADVHGGMLTHTHTYRYSLE